MRCGHCKIADTTVEHVRRCSVATYAPEGFGQPVPEDDEPRTTPAPVVRFSPVTEAGIYRRASTEEIFKVQQSPTSGHLYAKLFRPPTEPGKRAVFTYWPGALRNLRAEDRLTVEEAAKYGALYGTCIVCGRTLTKESSIEAGIGPICAGKV